MQTPPVLHDHRKIGATSYGSDVYQITGEEALLLTTAPGAKDITLPSGQEATEVRPDNGHEALLCCIEVRGKRSWIVMHNPGECRLCLTMSRAIVTWQPMVVGT